MIWCGSPVLKENPVLLTCLPQQAQSLWDPNGKLDMWVRLAREGFQKGEPRHGSCHERFPN